jgi:hypothetical protein
MKNKFCLNRLNYLLRCKKIIDIVNANYEEHTTYAKIYRIFVYPVYPMSYKSFMKIINMNGINRQIEELKLNVENYGRHNKKSN